MANFVLLYIGGGSVPEDPAQIEAINQAWGAWFEKLGDAVVDGGHPFSPAVKSIGSGGRVTDGPVGTSATGYSILKADSLSAAVELAKGCPILLGDGQISVYEAVPVM